jgi:hypothetical protein
LTTKHNDFLLNPKAFLRLIATLVRACFFGAGFGAGAHSQSKLVNVDAGVYSQSSLPPAAELVNEVVANELADREERRTWMYMVAKREGKQTLTEEQVDTKDGPLYRLLAIDGTPLNQEQRQKEDARLDSVLRDPLQQLTRKLEHEQDEQKLEKLVRLMPEVFVYDYAGVEGNMVRISFRPNASYNPTTYEARVAHSLAGTILIDAQQKRLAGLAGKVIDRVEFGYGLLGHIDKGGTIEIGRVEVEPSRWKTALIHIQITGRLVFFKTVNKQEFETRSEFRALPGDPGLLEASRLLPR